MPTRRPAAHRRGSRERRSTRDGADDVFAVVATAGTTNFGIVDDLAGVAEVCRELGLWFHVDGAYGGGGLAAPSVAHRFAGVERADSFIVDPHKWLFAPFDCCALLYRDPARARRAHTQQAAYLDVAQAPASGTRRLLRRADPPGPRPAVLVLARAHGTAPTRGGRAHARAYPRSRRRRSRAAPYLELVREPDLSVVVFRRLGWAAADYQAWSDRLLADEFAFVVPTTHDGETVTRFAIVNPRTTRTTSRHPRLAAGYSHPPS